MEDDARAVSRRWFQEVWTEGREEAIYELFSSSGIAHGLGEEADVIGPDQFKLFWRNMRSAFPDVKIEVEDIVAEGDRASARLLLTGTHSGDGLGVAGTGRKVNVRGIAFLRASGGQIAEAWNCWDQLGLFKQIGIIPGRRDAFLFDTEETSV